MKQLFVILLLPGMLVQTFSRFFIVVDYEINKEYIAQNLCENKDKPVLKCNGKCQMMKKLEQEGKKDQQNPERKMENKFEIISFQPTALAVSPIHINSSTIYPIVSETTISPFITTPFHPPRV